MEMKKIQEEAKKRFPIGCHYKGTDSSSSRILKNDFNTYRIVENMIYAHSGGGCLYNSGEWAVLYNKNETPIVQSNHYEIY
jgi:hypothetical protein